VLSLSAIGFHLPRLMEPNGPLGQFMPSAGPGVLSFVFAVVVAASVARSLPFMSDQGDALIG